MGDYQKKNSRTPGPGRVLLIPMLGTILLILIVMIGVLSRDTDPFGSDPDPIVPTLAPNPYGPEDFKLDGEYMTCTAGKTRLGVDVSEHQMTIDWDQVADAGMEFAFVRVGYRGYTEGGIYPDEHAAENLSGARKAGLKVGAYFYSQAISTEEAVQEAEYCISFLTDYKIDLPIVFDWEYVSAEARTGSMDKQTLTECAKAFCKTIENAGYQAMVYFNPHIADSYLDLFALEDYPFWLSQYDGPLDYPNKVAFWQYTASGKVPGIPGETDINLWFVD